MAFIEIVKTKNVSIRVSMFEPNRMHSFEIHVKDVGFCMDIAPYSSLMFNDFLKLAKEHKKEIGKAIVEALEQLT